MQLRQGGERRQWFGSWKADEATLVLKCLEGEWTRPSQPVSDDALLLPGAAGNPKSDVECFCPAPQALHKTLEFEADLEERFGGTHAAVALQNKGAIPR